MHTCDVTLFVPVKTGRLQSWLRRVPLMWKLLGIVVQLELLFAATLFLVLLPSFRTQFFEQKQAATRNLVDAAYSQMVAFQALEQAGTLTREVAQERAVDVARSLRYAQNNYVWVQTAEPRMVYHPTKPELNGTDISAITDSRGLQLYVEFARAAQNADGGFVSYWFTKPKVGGDFPKLSYVKRLAGWDWVVGSGAYIDDIDTEVRRLAMRSIGVAAVVGIFGLLLSLLAINILRDEVRSVENALQQTASGKLTGTLAASARDEIGRIALSYNKMNGRLRDLIGDVQGASTQMLTATREIAQGNDEVSRRVEQEASAVQSAYEKISRLSDASKATAAHAEESAKLVREATQQTTTGQQAIETMRAAITSISESSIKVTEITNLVDELAFQTNILALNAAVEAARAGDHGRGFAVVAGEVQQLARRSAAASREIKDLVNTSVEQAKNGQSVTNEVAAAMSSILSCTERLSSTSGSIVAEAQAQYKGFATARESLSTIEAAAQQNAAFTQQVSASTQSLKEQADGLSSLLRTFET